MNNYNQEILTIQRGKLCPRAEERWAKIKALAGSEDLEKLKRFIGTMKDSGNFSGVLFTNTFRVNREIALTSVGFFGPHNLPEAKYNVAIIVEELRSQRVATKYNLRNVNAFKGKIFHVNFPRPVNIQPNIYYNIRFQLDGPETGICEAKSLKNEVNIMDYNFDFLRGSMQMPEISFIRYD